MKKYLPIIFSTFAVLGSSVFFLQADYYNNPSNIPNQNTWGGNSSSYNSNTPQGTIYYNNPNNPNYPESNIYFNNPNNPNFPRNNPNYYDPYNPTNPNSSLNNPNSNLNNPNWNNQNLNRSSGYLGDAATAEPVFKTGHANDQAISQKIREAISRDRIISGQGKSININSEWGNVTLAGNVKNDSEKNKIEAIAKSVSGVKKVDNQLKVK